MTDTLNQVLQHPVTAVTSGSASAGVIGAVAPVHDTATLIMQILTFTIGILPGVLQIFKKKKK